MTSATLTPPEEKARESEDRSSSSAAALETPPEPASAAADAAEDADTNPTPVAGDDPSLGDLAIEAGEHETEPAEGSETSDEADSSSGGPPPEPEPHPERSAALAPFFAKLHQLLDSHRELERPSQINIGENSLQITVWERELTLQILDGEAGGQPRWIRRVAESVAFQTKAMVDLDRLARAEEASEDTREHILHDLYIGAAVGRALYVEIQKVVDKMVLSREMDLATKLTQLRNRVKVARDWIKAVLDADTQSRAESFADELICVPSDAVLPDPKKRKRRRRRTSDYEQGPRITVHASGRVDRDRRRIRLMAACLLSLTAVWIYFVLMPFLATKKIPELSIRDFRTITEIESVKAAPPSLYITVSSRDWNDLGDSGKQWVVDASARIAKGSGYSGAVFYTSDGTAVAQWLQKKGTSIYPPQPSAQ